MGNKQEAIRKELLDRATGKGKEPNWGSEEPTQLQLVQALNFYSANVEADQLKKYAITWAKKNCPGKVELIEAQTDWKLQTYGALMRMDSRGLKLPKAALKQIDTFVKDLQMPVTDETKSNPKPRKKKMSNENANYRNFCDALDNAVAAKAFKQPDLEVVKGHSTASVIEVCQREMETMKEDPSLYPSHMNKWFRAVIKIMNGGEMPEAANAPSKSEKKVAKPAAETPVKAAKPEKPKAAPKKAEPKPAKAPKAKAVADQPSGDDAATDHVLNGKTVAFLFDTRYGRLTRMVSSSKNGFQVKGKTLHNIDDKKSKVALLKNYGDAMKPGASNEEQLAEWMTKCVKKGGAIKVGGRLAQEILILNAA